MEKRLPNATNYIKWMDSKSTINYENEIYICKKKTRRIFYAQTNNGYSVTLVLCRFIFLFSNFKVSL